MYKLTRIDLMDAYIWADVFEYEAYDFKAESDDLDNLLNAAITGFKKDNTDFKTYYYWAKEAEGNGWEWEILDQFRSVFRGSMLLVDPMIERALRLAQKWHKKAVRKCGGKPYLIHILDISHLIYRNYKDEKIDILAASICHDLLEDTACPESDINNACSPEVLRIVKACTADDTIKDWDEKKLDYIKNVKSNGEKAMLVCLYDKIVNIKALLALYETEGADVWKHFNRGKYKKLWFERRVLEMLQDGLSHPLIEVYENLIEEVYNSQKSPEEIEEDKIGPRDRKLMWKRWGWFSKDKLKKLKKNEPDSPLIKELQEKIERMDAL